jgi:hypothetical protein
MGPCRTTGQDMGKLRLEALGFADGSAREGAGQVQCRHHVPRRTKACSRLLLRYAS